jgi:hypothetical protein
VNIAISLPKTQQLIPPLTCLPASLTTAGIRGTSKLNYNIVYVPDAELCCYVDTRTRPNSQVNCGAHVVRRNGPRRGACGCRRERARALAALEFPAPAAHRSIGCGDDPVLSPIPAEHPRITRKPLALGSQHELENVKRGAGDATATFCSAPWTSMCWSEAVISLPL